MQDQGKVSLHTRKQSHRFKRVRPYHRGQVDWQARGVVRIRPKHPSADLQGLLRVVLAKRKNERYHCIKHGGEVSYKLELLLTSLSIPHHASQRRRHKSQNASLLQEQRKLSADPSLTSFIEHPPREDLMCN